MTNDERYQLIQDTRRAGNPNLTVGQQVTVYRWLAGDIVKYTTGQIWKILDNGKVAVNLKSGRREFFQPHLVR